MYPRNNHRPVPFEKLKTAAPIIKAPTATAP